MILEMLFRLRLPIGQRLSDAIQESQHFGQLIFQTFRQLLDARMGQLLDPFQAFVCQPLVDGPSTDLTTAPIDQLDGLPQAFMPETQAVDLCQQVIALFTESRPFRKNRLIPVLA